MISRELDLKTNLHIHQDDIKVTTLVSMHAGTFFTVGRKVYLVAHFLKSFLDDPTVDRIVLGNQNTHMVCRRCFIGRVWRHFLMLAKNAR
jgi:hypothetical protein